MASEKFEVEIISQGSFIDSVENDIKYNVRVITLRLNHVALNEYLSSCMFNVRECYVDGDAGDKEWEAHKLKYEKRKEAFERQIYEFIGITYPSEEKTGVTITQSLSEIFTVIIIKEIKERSDGSN